MLFNSVTTNVRPPGSAPHGSPSFSFGKAVLTLTLNLYPERMIKCFIIDAGVIPNMLYTFVRPFLGEKTNKRIFFLVRKKKAIANKGGSGRVFFGNKSCGCWYSLVFWGRSSFPSSND